MQSGIAREDCIPQLSLMPSPSIVPLKLDRLIGRFTASEHRIILT